MDRPIQNAYTLDMERDAHEWVRFRNLRLLPKEGSIAFFQGKVGPINVWREIRLPLVDIARLRRRNLDS